MGKYETKFKLKVVERFLAGEGGAKLLARRWSVPEEKIRTWVRHYRLHGIAALQPKRGAYSAEFKLQSRLSLSMLPLALPLGAWKLSLLVNSALGCHAVGKEPQACLVMDVDVQPVLALGAWWGMLLWGPGLVLSGLLVGQVLAGKLPRPWGGRRDAR